MLATCDNPIWIAGRKIACRVCAICTARQSARVYRKPSEQQHDRLPLSTYEQAVKRLVQVRCDESVTDEAYSLAVAIVADVFWLPDARVRRDVAQAARQIGA